LVDVLGIEPRMPKKVQGYSLLTIHTRLDIHESTAQIVKEPATVQSQGVEVGLGFCPRRCTGDGYNAIRGFRPLDSSD